MVVLVLILKLRTTLIERFSAGKMEALKSMELLPYSLLGPVQLLGPGFIMHFTSMHVCALIVHLHNACVSTMTLSKCKLLTFES